MDPWTTPVLGGYFTVLLLLAIFGIHRAALVWLYYRHRHRAAHPPAPAGPAPTVLVQLPVYNEATVVERLIDAVCALEHPRDRLEIQVLDDSTDETVEIARAKVARMRERGFRIQHLHRRERTGFKAGALAAGLARSRAELVAIFDADFVPGPDLLRRTLGWFADPRVGMVQVRWGHLNRRFSLFTRLQSLLLDGHFVIEHTARNRSGRFFNFNGTAGVWRRRCIEEAGGWQHDTLTEDLDLSYRAQLRGWRFVFLPEVVSPAELPIEMNAFKSQQHRWAKGSIQVCRKLLPAIWRSGAPLKAKVEATFHLTANFAYPLMIALSLLLPPAVVARAQRTGTLGTFAFDLALFLAATASVFTFYLAAQREVSADWRRSIAYFPLLVALGIGISVNNARAVLEALLGRESPFVRTPKYAARERGAARLRYAGGRPRSVGLELLLALYLAAAVAYAFAHGLPVTAGLVLPFVIGYAWVGVASLLPPPRTRLQPA